MGVVDASIPLKKANNFTPGNQHYISFDSSKILSNDNFSKNLKDVISTNTDKKNNPKINIINSSNCFNTKNNTNNNLINNDKKKLPYLKSANTSKTVDKKITNNNINTTNIYSNNNFKNNSTNQKKNAYLREDSKKYIKSKEKNLNNNINIHNNSSKDVIPFYYKPKRILTQKASKTSGHSNSKSNNNNKDLLKNKKEVNMNKTKSKENFNTKNISNNNINNTGLDIHRSFNNISRVSSSDKFNIINNSYVKKKLNYKIGHMIDIHNYYNENKIKPLYLIDDINLLNNKKNDKKYSNENDYNNIIRHNKDNSNKLKMYMDLMKLKERKWQEEIINISKLISNNRMPKNKNNLININYIIQKIIILYDHFNWLINSIGFVYNSVVYDNKKELLNNCGLMNLNFPPFNSVLWFKGFKWKGLYIRIDKDINCINNIKKEIKALNYFFLDYLLIIWNDNKILDDYDNNINNNILSNNIIFPLIGYCQINSFILIVSSIIKPERNNNNNLNDIVEHSRGMVGLYSKIKINLNENNIYGNKMNKNNKFVNKYHYNENIKKHNNNFYNININDFNKNKFITNKINRSIDFNNNRNKNTNTNNNKNEINNKNITTTNNITNNTNDITYYKDSFYINDLLKSKLFTEVNKNNLIKVKGGKFFLINIARLIPNLFENKFCNDIKKINFFGVVDGEKKYYTLNYFSSFNVNIDNILNFNPLNNIGNNDNNKSENIINNTPKKILENIYNIYPSQNMKFKNIKIGNLSFRILYFNIQRTKKILKKRFVDILFNYTEDKDNNSSSDKNNNDTNNNENEKKEFTYIREPYVIIYDLLEPIKLDYSLIKSTKMKDNQTEVIKNIYFLRTNYIGYFLSWCDMMNKNSYNIKKYSDLKYFLKKYGINQNLLFFGLIKINNSEITDIIKIHLLIKALKFICFQKDNEFVMNEIKKRQKAKDITELNKEIKNINLNENLKSKIIFYIKSIIYPNELLPIGQKIFKDIYEQIAFYANILFFKYKLIDDYLSLGLLNNDNKNKNNKNIYTFFNIESPQDFVKHIIYIARKKPFLFISEMEYKLNFIIDPFVKFKCSISIESMSHQLDVVHINFNSNIIKTYVEPEEISGLILTKIIKKYKEKQNILETENSNRNLKINNENNKLLEDNNNEIENENNIKNNKDYNSLNNKPAVLNTKINILSIKNNVNNNNIDEDINDNMDNENTNKNEDNKSNFSNINNIYTNNNSHILLRNNSNNSNTNINSKDNSNIDNNEAGTKISNDKTMDESDISKIQNLNIQAKIDSNMNNIPPNQKNNKNIINNSNSNINNLKENYDNIIIFLPTNCYKILLNYEINNNNQQNLYQNLEQFYIIKNIHILKEWANINEIIYKNLFNSYNGNCEYTLIKSYIYYFLFVYYVERNRKESIKINNKLLSLFKNNFSYQLTLNDLAIINLIQALSNNDYIENEEYFSKCVMLLLINYGDPRGRYNDSHGAMQFPLWEISRKTYKLEQPIINENFKEMYQALDFFDKRKGIFNLSVNQYDHLYNINYMYNIIKNFEKIKLMNIIKNKKNNSNYKNTLEMNDSESIYSMVNNIDENPNENYINRDLTDKNISISNSIFDNAILQKTCIKHNIFPSISCKSPNVGKVFYRKDFIIYIIKEIQSLLMGRGIIINKKYIDKKISEDIIIIKEKKNNLLNQGRIRDNSNNKFNETPLKEKYINNFNREKQIGNSSSKTNPYYEIEKKYNDNRNTQYLPRNNHTFNTSNISKSYNSSISTSNGINKKNDNKNNSNSNNKINNRKTISNNNYNTNILNKKPKKLFSHFLYVELLQKLSFKKNLPSGIIISFGNNTHNETSHDRYEKLTLPRVIFKLKNEMIKNISSGWQHNIVLNNDGEIFSFGHNQEYQCGVRNTEKNLNSSNSENINDPTNISILNNNLRAIKVSCGNEHSLIISQDNNVYGFGNNENSLLGIPDKKIKIYKPTKINFEIFNGKDIIEEYNGKIVSVSCGTLHSLALTDDGKIFSWGSYHGGQLGFSSDFLTSQNKGKNSEQDLFLETPTLIPYFSKNEIKIQKISCGEAHSLALSDKGKVYSWGFGTNGQLGLGFCEDSFEPGQGLIKSRIFEPELIKTFKDYNNSNNLNKKNKISNNCHNIRIKDIQCGKTFSTFINNTNSLFACGINDLNQLGFKDIEPKENLFNPEIQCDDYIYPSLLKCFENKKVEKISCGEGHCLAIINDTNSNIQSIWSWGNNKFGQLGHGSIVTISLPKEVEYLTEYNMNKFCEVSCGGFHSLCLLKSKNNLDWIESDYNENILEVIEEIGGL